MNKELTSEQNAVAGFINDLIDDYDKIGHFFMTKPDDYKDGKDAWQELLRDIANYYWLPKEK